jgi:hypothetical protein
MDAYEILTTFRSRVSASYQAYGCRCCTYLGYANADEVRSFTCGLLFLPTEARRALRQELEGSVVAVLGLPSKGTTKGTNARNLGHKK